MKEPLYGLTGDQSKRIAQLLHDAESTTTDVTGRRGRRRMAGTRGFWAKITGSADIGLATGGYSYAFTEQYWNGTNWAAMPDGQTGTTSVNYAINTLEDTTTDSDPIAVNTVVWLLPGFDSTGVPVWLTASPFGYTGGITRHGAVHWTGSTLTQDTHEEVFRNGLLVSRTDDTQEIIDTADSTGCA